RQQKRDFVVSISACVYSQLARQLLRLAQEFTALPRAWTQNHGQACRPKVCLGAPPSPLQIQPPACEPRRIQTLGQFSRTQVAHAGPFSSVPINSINPC